MYAMGDEAEDIILSFNLTEEDSKKYSVMKDKFESYFVKRKNIIYQRVNFNAREQEDGESVDTFITSLYSLAEKCVFVNLYDDMIRDRIIVGIKDTVLSELMQLDDDLTLEKTSKMVRQSEQVKQEQRDIREEKAKQVQSVRERPTQTRKVTCRQTPETTKHTLKEECLYKMWESSHGRTSCPANEGDATNVVREVILKDYVNLLEKWKPIKRKECS